MSDLTFRLGASPVSRLIRQRLSPRLKGQATRLFHALVVLALAAPNFAGVELPAVAAPNPPLEGDLSVSPDSGQSPSGASRFDSEAISLPQPPPDLIFADGFESGSFSAWSAATTDSGDLSVTAPAAIAGSYGMQALIDDNTAIYVTDQTPNAAARYRARFHFDPNSIAMAEGNAHFILYGYMGTSTVVLRVELRRYYGDFEIRASFLNDSTGWNYTAWLPVRDQMQYFELDWRAASYAGASDGRLTVWIDGGQRADLTGWDNDTRRIDLIRFGAVAGIDTGTRGTYFFDAFESRSETAIGPDPGAPEPASPAEVIFGDAFETGDFIAWSGTTIDGGDLSVATAAALVGVHGLKALLDDNNAIYVTDWSPVAEPQYHGRLYFDPNTLPMASGNAHYILYGYMGTSTGILRLEFRFYSGAYQLRLSAASDGTSWVNTAWTPIADASHSIEVEWSGAYAEGTNDGWIRLYVDGAWAAEVIGIDNDTRRLDFVRLGAVSGVDTATRGTYYFDAYQSWRTSEVGPVGSVPQQSGASRLLLDDHHPSLFTGQLRYAYPIWAPPGRAGLAPALTLAYASGVVDGWIGDVQAPWVGAGWNLDAVEVVRTITTSEERYGYQDSFALTFNSVRYPLAADPGTPGRYRTEDESFLYIQRHNEALGNAGSVANATHEWWEVVARDGTRYRLGWSSDAEQRAFMSGYACTTGSPCTSPEFPYTAMGYAGVGTGVVALRWRLDRVLDRHGNFMTYAYTEDTKTVGSVTFDRASYLASIRYTGHQDAGGSIDLQPGYEIRFVQAVRPGDRPQTGLSLWDTVDSQLLDRIEVCYGTCAGGTVVRLYDLSFGVEPEGPTDGTLVLTGIAASSPGFSESGQAIAAAAAPTVRFTYTGFPNIDPGCQGCMQIGYPRLTEIENGYGGTVSYTYEDDSPTPDRPYAYRVARVVTHDGLATAAWREFTYQNPVYPTGSGLLIGYQTVSETSYEVNGTTPILETRHSYGTTAPDVGRELQTDWRNGAGTTLRRTVYTWTTDNAGLPPGVTFRYVQRQERYERSGGALTLIAQSAYARDPATGNLTQQQDTLGASLYRTFDLSYTVNADPAVWILDRLSLQTLRDSGGTVRGEQRFYYDGSLTAPPLTGDLTLMQARTGAGSQTIDTGYTYDVYGNLLQARAYEAYGTAGTAPGGAYQATAVAYDATLHALPVSVTNALGQTTSIATLFALGLPYRLTDPNNLVTTTTYDGLGRTLTTTAPGFGSPNLQTFYPVPNGQGQVSVPYAIETRVWDTLGPGGSTYRSAWTIYDGLGRSIQSQASDGAGGLFLTDVAYNAQGLTARQGIPRTVAGSGGTYQSPSWGAVLHTLTDYDPLGRPIEVIRPGDEDTRYSYDGLTTTGIDPNGHQTGRVYDAFGRQVTVREYSGEDPSFTLYATTTYAYDVADRLTGITDAHSNPTSMTYDWLGRKTTMDDPDAGALSYGYDPLGNLTSQTDARGCVTSLTYDDLNRPTGRTYSGPGACSSTPAVTYTYDNTAGGNLGIGRRTGMADASGSAAWVFTNYGRTVEETRTINGAPQPYEVISVSDWMGRLAMLAYPDGEGVTYSYDALGRAAGLASSVAGNLATLAYTSAGQLSETALGNGFLVQNCYRSEDLRLSARRAYPGSAQACSVEHPAGAAIDFTYAYDASGNITALNDAVRAEAFNFTYDFLDRLVAAGGVSATSILYLETYQHDQLGTITNTTEHSGASSGPGIYEEGSSSLWLAGAWNTVSDAGASGGARSETTQAGAAVRLIFFGAGLRYVRPVGPDQGIAEIYVDGQLVSEVDNYAAEPAQQSATDVAAVNGDHYLEVRVTGRANPASSGATVGLDTIVVLQDPPAGEGTLRMLTLETEGDGTAPLLPEPTATETATPTPTATDEVWETPAEVIIEPVPGTPGPEETLPPEPSATPEASPTAEPSPTSTAEPELTPTPSETPAGMSVRGPYPGAPFASEIQAEAPGKHGRLPATGPGWMTLVALVVAVLLFFAVQRSAGARAWSGALGILLALVVVGVAFADFIGPQRTVITQSWERKRCDYHGTIPGYGCNLFLSYPPSSSCPSTSSVRGYFSAHDCQWPHDCSYYGGSCVVTKTYDGVVGCSPGEAGCTLVTHTTTLPPATVSGTFTCATPGPNGWCLGGGALNLSASEPLAGHVITLIENDTGTLCDPPDAASVSCTWDQGVDGNYVIEFWAHSSRGDTSAKGSAVWRQDTTGPVSQFTEPLEGSTTPASGIVSLSGTSVDAASGVAGAEIWLEGAGDWQPLEVVGGAWSTTWDTTTVTDGTYFVQVRAIDLAGNVGATAQVFLAVENEAPVNAPAPRATDEAHPHAVAEVQHPDGTDTYTYDASGSQTQRTEDGVTYNQTVDGDGRLVNVQNTFTGETWAFTYDGDGNRVRQGNPDGASTLFLAGGLYELTLDAGGQQTGVKRYYAISGQPIALRDGSGTFYLLTDHLGSVVSVLDGSGTVVGEQRYRPFGQPRLTPGIAQTDRGFTGQHSLAAVGLQDFNARWVDASLGMFSSPDSLIPNPFNPQALNRYGYVLNNPLRYTDPTGHMLSECGQFGEECGGSPIQIPSPLVAAKSTTTSVVGAKTSTLLSTGGLQPAPVPIPSLYPTSTPEPPAQPVTPNPAVTPAPTGSQVIGCPTVLPGQECGELRDVAWWSISVDPSAVDVLDLSVDAFGIVGEALQRVPPYGPFVWGASEVAEILTLGKSWDELDLGNPGGALVDVGSTLLQSSKLSPAFGYLGNFVSIALNLGGALTLQVDYTYVLGSPQ